MRFLLIRHGETVWNTQGRYQGNTDIQLSELGRKQAALLAERLQTVQIDHIYASPLSRAYDTAMETAKLKGMEVTVDERLRELDFGVWDGLTRDELAEKFGDSYKDYRKEPFHYPFPGEGSLNHAKFRVGMAIEEIKEKYYNTDQTVAVFAHGGILKLAIFHLLDLSSRYYRNIELDNTSITIIDVLPDRCMLQLLNDANHLR